MRSVQLRNVISGIATATVLSYFYLGSPPRILPETGPRISDETIRLPIEYDTNPYYAILDNEIPVQEQIETVHNFVSTILENTQDLNPDFSKLVDEHFWDLV